MSIMMITVLMSRVITVLVSRVISVLMSRVIDDMSTVTGPCDGGDVTVEPV